MRITALALSVVLFAMLGFGCSAGDSSNPVSPNEMERESLSDGSHQLWGYYQFTADPSSGTLDVIPLRHSALHLNALQFLEPPPLVNLTLESLKFNGNIIEADIGLRHPFLGLNEFTGFDVCGILITNGNVTGYSNPAIRMAGPGDTRLLNPDGFSRWWNPAEFPVNSGTMFSYKDGLLGTADAVGHYNSTLNGYKYFCDDLSDPDESIENITLERRGLFSAGLKNIRHYAIELGNEGLVFNYAVDASWAFPTGQMPYDVPDDFPPKANRPEAYRVSIGEIENTLYYVDDTDYGGGLSLLIDVYDWSNPGLNTVDAESLLVFDEVSSTTPVGAGKGYSTYQLDITDVTLQSDAPITILISVEDPSVDYGGLLPGENITSYFVYVADIEGEAPEVGGNWLVSQGNIGHTGYLGRYGPSEVHSDPTWTSEYIPPIGNALSIFLNNDTAFMSFAGVIYDTWFPTIAVNLADGSTKWTYAFHEETDYYTQPKGISADGLVLLVCEVYSPLGPTSGIIAGLDVGDGHIIWQLPGNDIILVDSYATLDLDGNFIVPIMNYGYRSIDPSDGTVNWNTSGATGYCTPAVGSDGTIYGLATGAVAGELHAYNPATGADKWTVFPSVGSSNFGVTVSDDGKIIVAGNNGVFCFTDSGTAAAMLWQQPYTYCPYGSAAVGPNGDIYLVDNDIANGGNLRRLDPLTGATLDISGPWTHAGTRPVVGEDGMVYVNSRQHIRAFNPDCTLYWEYYGGSHNHFAAPAIAKDGTLYSAKKELGLYAWKD